MECPRCKAAIIEGNRFCEECGAPVSMSCPSCGAPIRPGAKFCGKCGGSTLKTDASTAPAAAPTSPSAPQTAPSSLSSAERRQLTVMFCDLVGSTALAARMDPEDLREVIGTYHRRVARAVTRFGGFVAKYMGDGVLVYFGYPHAHEDDAERAVRAGLKLMSESAEPSAPSKELLSIRVGIATGLVVVGDLIGSGEAQERGVVGETPNLAARLQALAAPNAVVIAESTRQRLGTLFECSDLGKVELKGIAEPVQAWQVVRPGSVEGRFEALHTAALTPLVGREEEIDLLQRRWQRAKSGEGQVVLLSAEPGIGKSRIAAAVQERIAGEPHTRLRYFCSPHHQDSALHPTIAQLERAAGFERDDVPETKLDRLQALLGPATPSEDVALFAELLSIPVGLHLPRLDLTPQRKKERTFEALLGQLEGLARAQPVLMIFEDVHWLDPTSRELLDLAVERTSRLPVLLLITFRPEFQPPWIGLSHVTMLALNRLDRRAGLLMVEQIVGTEAMARDLLEEIVARTDGVPLFVEELTKAVLEADAGERDTALSRTPAAARAVPATLHASLMARLDRLGPIAKEIAQIGAALGREFSYELLAAASRSANDEMRRALERLVGAGLVFQRGTPPEAMFQFKHALVQDAAYGTMLRGNRQELHARIAAALEAGFPQIIETQPEALARHFTEAGLAERAIGYWQRAGERAAKRSANREAVAHLGRGLQLLEALPDRAAHADEELRLLIAIGPALMNTRSSAAPEIERTYARARVLARETGRLAELFPTVWGSWLVAFSSGEITTAGRLVEELFGIVQGETDSGLLLQARHAAWPTVLATGDLLGARRHIEAALALYDREKHSQHAHLYGGHDPGVCGYVSHGLNLVTLGYPHQAVEQIERGLDLAREIDHKPSLAQALWFRAELHHLRREPQAVEAFADAVLPLVSQHGSVVGVANATMLQGWALVAKGATDDGIAELRKGLDAWRGTGSKFNVPYRLGRAADAFRLAGLFEHGLDLVAEATRAMEQTGDRWFEPELHRLTGEMMRLPGRDQAELENCFRRALDLARARGARLFELRAATSLARLWRDQGKQDAARDLLAPVFGRFTEGFETADLQEAKAVLDAAR
jgi:class 3 adenylate cyclase/predicted ATPase